MIASDFTTLEEAEKTISVLQKKLKASSEAYSQLEAKFLNLQEQFDLLRRQVFGKKSEKVIPESTEEQLYIPGTEPEDIPVEKEQEVAAHTRRTLKRPKGDKIQWPEDTPIEEKILDISEEEKEGLIKIGEEVSDKLAHRPGMFFIQRIIRPKYAKQSAPDEGVVCHEMPDALLNRSRADESLIAEVLTRKYGDHLPLYRLEEIFAREGVLIPRQVLSQWSVAAALALEPLYNEMKKAILTSGTIFVDETPIDMLAPGKGKTDKTFMWVVVGGGENPSLRLYHFCTNRKHVNADELLEDYEGVYHSDKYGAYEKLAYRVGKTWCPCWAHIRRKFFEADTGDPPFRKWILRQIKYLFMYERIAWQRTPEERLKIRQEREIPIIDKIIEETKKKLHEGKCLPKSKMQKAIGYLISLIPFLKNYTQHASARIDNNTAERAIRPLAIGRKNWLFLGSPKGGKAAAIIISLIQSCRGLEINPREYLDDVMRRLMSHNSQKLRELLPDQWTPSNTNSPQ